MLTSNLEPGDAQNDKLIDAPAGVYNSWDWISNAAVPAIYEFKDYADKNLDAWDRNYLGALRALRVPLLSSGCLSSPLDASPLLRMRNWHIRTSLSTVVPSTAVTHRCRHTMAIPGEYNRVVGGLFLLQSRGARFDSLTCETAHTSFFPVRASHTLLLCPASKGIWYEVIKAIMLEGSLYLLHDPVIYI